MSKYMILWLVAALLSSAVSASSADTLLIEQIGAGHIAGIQQASPKSYARITQTDTGNTALIGQGGAMADRVAMTEAIDEGYLANFTLLDTVGQGGRDNSASVIQAGDGQQALILQGGERNSAVMEQSGSANRGAVLQEGAGNFATLEQAGAGNLGIILSVGDDNTATLVQDGLENRGAISLAGSRNQVRLTEIGNRNDATVTILGNDNGYELNILASDKQVAVKIQGDNVPLPLSSLTIRD
ncbi:hypothetical protein [Vreelandella aquamarina]|uniref:hypothetical protein n=1 Tax=Vreelandella aquamarina TaxID=77097 RepID=UPI00384C7F98